MPYSFEIMKKRYSENAGSTREIGNMANALSENLAKLYRNIMKTGRNYDVASTILKASSGVFGFVQDPSLIEFEDRNDPEKKAQKKWQQSADDFMAFFGLGVEKGERMQKDKVFDGPEKVDIKKLREQLAFFSNFYGINYTDSFVPIYHEPKLDDSSLDESLIFDTDTKEPEPEYLQTEPINIQKPVFSEEERRLRNEYAETVKFDNQLIEFASKLDSVHWYGAGGISDELQAVKNAVSRYFEYRQHSSSPFNNEDDEQKLVQDIADAANNYIAIKRREGKRNFSGRPDEPQWRPWSDMGKERFESSMSIETLANARVKTLSAARKEEEKNISSIISEYDDANEKNKTNNIINNEIRNNDVKPDEIVIENKQEQLNNDVIDNNAHNNAEEKPVENVNANNNIINEEPAREENIIEHNAGNVNNNEIIIENIEKNVQAKEEEKKAEPEKNEEKKAEPEKEEEKKAELEKKEEKKAEPEKNEEKKAEPEKNEEKKAEPEKNEEKKAEPEKNEEKKAESEKKEEKKAEPEKNTIIKENENKNKINLPEENEAEVKESPEEKALRIKKAKVLFNSPRMTVGKLANTLADMYDYDDLDHFRVTRQIASIISAKELTKRYKDGIPFANVEDRFEGRRNKLYHDDIVEGYASRLLSDPNKAKRILRDPDALIEGYTKLYNCRMERKAAFDKYGMYSTGGYIANAKYDIALDESNDAEPYRYLIVAQAMAKKTGLRNQFPADEYNKLYKQVDPDTLKETFGGITPEIKQKILDEPDLALEMYSKNAKKKGLAELGAEPVDPLKDKTREELKKKAGENAGPTIDDEIKSLKDHILTLADSFVELMEALAKYTALVKMKKTLGGGDVPVSAVNEEYTKAWKDLKYEDNIFHHIENEMGYDGSRSLITAYVKDPDNFVEEYDRQTDVDKEFTEKFTKYPPCSVGRRIASIKYEHQRDLRGRFLGIYLEDVMILHAIGQKMGYDYQVTNTMFNNMDDICDYEVYRPIFNQYSKADKINMMSDPKALDKLIDEYNNAAVNRKEPKQKLEFDPLTMSRRGNYNKREYNSQLLKPVSENDPHIGDIRKYQNNIRKVINEVEPGVMDQKTFEEAKDTIMKNTAQIIATRAIWPRTSEKSIAQINDEMSLGDPKFKKDFMEENQKKNDNCLDLSMNIYEKRKDFKRMFDDANDWNSLVDLSKKALTKTGLEITFKLREAGKILEFEQIKAGRNRKLNNEIKPKVLN